MDTRDRIGVLLFLHLCVITVTRAQVAGTGTVIEVLQKAQGLGKFAELFGKANLDDQFGSQTKFTIFAPNNTAFENIPQEVRNKIYGWAESSKELRQFIYFHSILDLKLVTSDMSDNSVYNSRSENGNKIFINKRTQTAGSSGFYGPTVYFVNGARISSTQRDMVATNGVIQGLDSFITVTSNSKVYAYINSPDDSTIKTKEFYDLLGYLRGIYVSTRDSLSTRNRITMFVPSDDAFKKIPSAKLSELRENPQELDRVIRSHIIPNRVIFTAYANHNQGFRNDVNNDKYTRFRKPTPNHIYVNSEGVDAQIVRGNITVSNGVIHVVDTVLGFVYNNVREIIQSPYNNASKFEQLLNRGSDELRNLLVQQSGVNVFVPVNSAFDQLYNVPDANLNSNLHLVDKVLRLHMLEAFEDVEVSNIVGGYESRVYKQSRYNRWRLTVYTERNETWVQGGYVKAGVIRPDLTATNGRVQIIDSVLGVPYLDIPMLICHDLWLLKTYDTIRAVGMKTFLTDDRFTAKQCDFERYGYPPGYDYGSNTYTNKQKVLQSSRVSSNEMKQCHNCKFTFFVPNSTAINAFQRDPVGGEIMKDAYKMQYVLLRHLFDDAIILENLPNGYITKTARTGERLSILKSRERDVQLQFRSKKANVIHMDQGATNGLVHIIDNVLFSSEDLTRVGSAPVPCSNLSCLALTFLLCLIFQKMLT